MTETTTATEQSARQRLRDEFIKLLEELFDRDDRAALATLRRGLGKPLGGEMEIYRYLGRFADRLTSRRQEEAYYLIATLFGLYPTESWKRGGDDKDATNLGASLRKLKGETGESIERRFVALLNAHSEDLPTHLRQVISLLSSKEMPVDWRQLLQDIENWDFDDERRIQRKWAKAFWRE
jgi:CRISPR system Cascade subunit CasB